MFREEEKERQLEELLEEQIEAQQKREEEGMVGAQAEASATLPSKRSVETVKRGEGLQQAIEWRDEGERHAGSVAQVPMLWATSRTEGAAQGRGWTASARTQAATATGSF